MKFSESALEAIEKKASGGPNISIKPNAKAVESAMKSIYGDESQAKLMTGSYNKAPIPVDPTWSEPKEAVKVAQEKLAAAETLQKEAEEILSKVAAPVNGGNEGYDNWPGSQDHIDIKDVDPKATSNNPETGTGDARGTTTGAPSAGGGGEALLGVKDKKLGPGSESPEDSGDKVAAIEAAYKKAFGK